MMTEIQVIAAFLTRYGWTRATVQPEQSRGMWANYQRDAFTRGTATIVVEHSKDTGTYESFEAFDASTVSFHMDPRGDNLPHHRQALSYIATK